MKCSTVLIVVFSFIALATGSFVFCGTLSHPERELSIECPNSGVKRITGTKYEVKMFCLIPYLVNNKKTSKSVRINSLRDAKTGRVKFVFSYVEKGSLFQKLGLRKGDTLLGLNHITFDSFEKSAEAIGLVQNAKELKLKVLRDKKVMILHYVKK